MTVSIQELLDAKGNIFESVATIEEGILAYIGEIHQLKLDKKALVAALNAVSPTDIPKPHLRLNIPQENNGWGDNLYYKGNDKLSVLSDEVIVCGGRSGIINTKNDFDFEIDWDRVTFIQGTYPTGWAAQLNRVFGTINDCTFLRIGDELLTHDVGVKDGHPLYFKPTDLGLSITSSKFLECQGNLQFAARPWEGYVPERCYLSFDRNLLVSNSHSPFGHGGGGATNLAIYCATNEGTNVDVTNNVFHNPIPYLSKAQAANGPAARGLITLFNEAFYPNKNRMDDGFLPDTDKKFSSAIITGNTIRSEVTDRPLFQIQGCDEILIEANDITIPTDQEFPYPLIRIDHDMNNPVRAKKIVIEPIDLPGLIQVGEELRPISEGFEYEAAGYSSHTL